nr:MAG TPA: hypothetical protein [Bacteriophage sp.]
MYNLPFLPYKKPPLINCFIILYNTLYINAI